MVQWRCSGRVALWLAVMVGAVTLVACAPVLTPTASPTQTLIPPTATVASALPPTATAEILIPAGAQALVIAARQDLASSLNVAAEQVELDSLETVTWPDAVLGCEDGTAADETPGYRILLRSGAALYEYHADEQGSVRQCGDAPDAEATLALNADPMAAELVMMAQQRVAAELDLSTRRIHVDSVEPMRWTDTSLNCPTPDITYEPAHIEGYRLVLSAGDQQYVFHSDFERLILCAPGQEQLPEATSES